MVGRLSKEDEASPKYQDIISKLSLEQKAALVSGKSTWETRDFPQFGIPSIFLADGSHGIRKQLGAGDHLGLNPSQPATCFPTAATVANSWDIDLCEKIGAALGEEAAAQDVNVLLGPGLNMKRNPLCGRNFEYFSEDPYLAGKLAAAYIRGIQSKGVAACPKHFAVNNQELRRMASNSVLDERTLREIYLTGFEIAVKEGHPKAIMTSYNEVNGIYANENPHLLQDILRKEWGYRGAVVTDWGGSNDHVEGVRCGSTLEMPGAGADTCLELVKAVREGELPEQILDDRVEELLKLAFPTSEALKKAPKNLSDDSHRSLAQAATANSIVLMKNEGDFLPLKPGTHVAVIGSFAKTPRYQGAGSSLVHPTQLDNAVDCVRNGILEYVGFAEGFNRNGQADEYLKAEALQLAKKSEVVLLYLGLSENSESEGIDRQHMKLPENQIDLLESLSSVNPNVVVILSAGSVVEMSWIDNCKAVLHGYLCGQAGADAMIDVINGQVNPSGHLCETYPVRYEDTPSFLYFPGKERNAEYREGLYIGYRYYSTAHVKTAFPFGFGLSYTSFSYSNLEVNPNEVIFTLTNTGKMDGAQVAQLYVGCKNGKVFRPARELKGFQKVFLKAGESSRITIPLDDKAFRYFNMNTDRWEVETADYELMVGSNAEDIELSATITIHGTEAECPYSKSKLPSYYSGMIRDVSDEEFENLLGNPIPAPKESGILVRNDPVCELYRGKSVIAHTVYRILTHMKDKSLESSKPDLNILFIYNITFRGIAKMLAGAVSMKMVDGLLLIVNGHFFKGIGKFLGGYAENKKTARQYEAALYSVNEKPGEKL
jgi:beta-glucosidase